MIIESLLRKPIQNIKVLKKIKQLDSERIAGLELYMDKAKTILSDSCIQMKKPKPEFFSIEKNFFTSIFHFSYFKAAIPAERRVLYSSLNQCLRGMVTGCDNILDNEYKITVDTDLPSNAVKFRSIIDIMLSDRILFALLYDAGKKGVIQDEKIMPSVYKSLQALTLSGKQEAEEEDGVFYFAAPDDILSKVHHFKTGVLFESPWAIPLLIEEEFNQDIIPIRKALYQIGMGCQLADDMVDLSLDLETGHHNYAASVIWFSGDKDKQEKLKKDNINPDDKRLMCHFPDEMKIVTEKVFSYLYEGTGYLFKGEYEFLSDMAVRYMCERIGISGFTEVEKLLDKSK